MDILEKLNCLKVETGSLACLGCEDEHQCSTHGCAILREAAEEIARLRLDVKYSDQHGTWLEDGDVQICSVCGEEHEWIDFRASYCDNCGAKMDGGKL